MLVVCPLGFACSSEPQSRKVSTVKLCSSFLAIVAILASTSALAQSAQPDRMVTYKTVGEKPLRLHVFEPAGKRVEPAAAIVFFFGGGWSSGSPSQFYPHCQLLAKTGVVAMAAEYRVAKRDGVKAIECVRDARDAVTFIRDHAKSLRIDPAKIAVGGGSAGGHLAACTALVDRLPGEEASKSLEPSKIPCALVLFNPALMLVPADDVAVTWPRDDVRKRTGVDPKIIDPYQWLDRDLPPTIIFHGTADSTVSIDSVRAFDRKAERLGRRCTLVEYPGQGHGFFNASRDDGKWFRATTKRMVEFLDEVYRP